jgi:hypothetical protein
MNFQQLLSDAQSKADANGDGKLNFDDLKSLADQHSLDETMINDLKAKGDLNGDGKVDIEDLKSVGDRFNLDDAKRQANEAFDSTKATVGNFTDDVYGRVSDAANAVKDTLFNDKK